MANAVEAKGNSRLQMENGPLGGRDGARWGRGQVAPLGEWTSGRVATLVGLDSMHLGLGVRKGLWVSHPKEK